MQNSSPKQKMFYGASTTIFQFAEANREKETPAEALLWKHLKNKQLNGLKFRRQHPIGRFILDFYCHSKRIAIELDGDYHGEKFQKQYDEARSEALLDEVGIRILRFDNQEVIENIDSVLAKINIFVIGD